MVSVQRKAKVFWIDLDEVADASFAVLEHLPILSEIEHKYKATRHIRTGMYVGLEMHMNEARIRRIRSSKANEYEYSDVMESDDGT